MKACTVRELKASK